MCYCYIMVLSFYITAHIRLHFDINTFKKDGLMFAESSAYQRLWGK